MLVTRDGHGRVVLAVLVDELCPLPASSSSPASSPAHTMRGLPFPTNALFDRDAPSEHGTPFSTADDIPIDPALAGGPPIDPPTARATDAQTDSAQQVRFVCCTLCSHLAMNASRVVISVRRGHAHQIINSSVPPSSTTILSLPTRGITPKNPCSMTRDLGVIRSHPSHPRLICRSPRPRFRGSLNHTDGGENQGARRNAGFARETMQRTSTANPSSWSPAKSVAGVVCLVRMRLVQVFTIVSARTSKLYGT